MKLALRAVLVCLLIAALPYSGRTQVVSGGRVPIATTSVAGTVKPDGTTITVAADGTITSAAGGSGCLVSGAAGIVSNNGANGCITDTSATLSSGSLTLGGSATIGAAGALGWTGRAALLSVADGKVLFTNNAQTDFTLLQVGGITATFPGLKRVGTTLAHRLANDSADGPMSASTGTFSGAVNKVTITAPATGSTLTLADGKTLTDTSGLGAVALKGATGGGFAQAACADLSNGAAGCSAALGTGVATALAINTGSAGAFVKNNGDALSGTFSGNPTFSGSAPLFTGLSAGTQVSCLGLDSGNHIVLNAAACGSAAVSVTAGTPNVVITPSPGTGTFTVGTSNIVNTQSGTGAYAIAAGDATKQVLRTNASGGADTIANATGSFGSGYSTTYTTGAFAGNTITPATATINGLSVLKLGANQYTSIDSDGTNYHAALGLPQPATQTGTTFLRDDMTWPTIASLGANPTANGGTAAVNGTAATFMRSDGAPAIPAMTATVAGLVPTPPNDATKYLNGQGGFTIPSGGSGGGITQYSDNGLTLTAGTRYVPIGGSGTPSSTEADYSTKSPAATTIANLQVNLSADPGAGQTLVVTLRKAGADTALTCTVTGGSGVICQDVAHSVNVAQNDLIDWKVVTTGTFVATPSVTILASEGTSNVGVTSVTCGTGLSGGVITTTGTCSLASANPAFLDVSQAYTKGQAVTPTVGGNTGAATVTPDASTSNGFTYTLTGNITLANPSNVKAGQVLNFQLTQDGTGSRTIALGSQYKFATATAPTWSTGAGKIDVLSCWWVTTTVGSCNAIIDVR